MNNSSNSQPLNCSESSNESQQQRSIPIPTPQFLSPFGHGFDFGGGSSDDKRMEMINIIDMALEIASVDIAPSTHTTAQTPGAKQ